MIVLQTTATDEFRRQQRLYGKRIKCKQGCDACCHTPFIIMEIEAAAISRASKSLPVGLRELLRSSARNYLMRRAEMFPESGYRDGRGELSPESARLPCPALVDGKCVVYEVRPSLCRLYGAVLSYPSHPNRAFACQLNFAPGEQTEDTHLAERQLALAEARSDVDKAYRHAGGRRFREPVTVAHALLEDFERYLPPRRSE